MNRHDDRDGLPLFVTVTAKSRASLPPGIPVQFPDITRGLLAGQSFGDAYRRNRTLCRPLNGHNFIAHRIMARGTPDNSRDVYQLLHTVQRGEA